MKEFRRLLAQAWPYRIRFALACVAMAGFGVTSAGLAYLIKPIFDDVLIQNINLGRVAGLIVVLYLAKGLCSYFATYLMSWVGQRTIMDLQLHEAARILCAGGGRSDGEDKEYGTH